MSQQPCRQLNSVAIRDEVLASIIPLVRTSCSILGVKCVWRVQGGLIGIQSAWNHIVDKRNECDAVVAKTNGVGFFFSAISTYQSTARGKHSKEENLQASDEDQDNDDEIHSSQQSLNSSQVPLAITKCAKNKTYPAITYWVAIQSPNGAPVDALILHSALVHCKVEVNSTRASSKKGGCEILNKLCQLLKDHKNDFMAEIMVQSYRRCRQELFQEITGEKLDDEQPLTEWERVVRMVIVREEPFPFLKVSVGRLKDVGLHFDVFDCKHILAKESIVDPPKQLGEPLTVLCNDIERALVKLDYGYREGDVYKKHPRSQYTYYRLCSMERFLNSLLGNPYFKDRLLVNMAKIQTILRHPDCEAITQFEVDRDLVEINRGWCWSFRTRRFVQQPFNQTVVGRTSPRAFIPYDHDQEVDAKFFKEILTNSLNQVETARFCEDFLQLFNCNAREHKQKVPCLIGPSNSGKTSLFMTTNKIIDVTKVAKVTKQREFNKAMIGEDTELINLDEASVDMMDVDDWKIITQGGWTAHDRKWKSAKGFINKAPIFITCQKDLDFGSVEDNVAMDNRLNRYHFQTLPTVKKNAAKWIQNHAMNCIVWAAEMAEGNPDKDDQEDDDEDSFEMEGLTTDDKAAILSLSLDDVVDVQAQNLEHDCDPTSSTEEEANRSQDSQEKQENHQSEDFENDVIPLLERAKHSCEYNLGKARMIDSMIAQAKALDNEVRRRITESRRTLHRQRQEHFRNLGVDDNLLHLLPTDPKAVIPTPLRQEIKEKQALRREADERAEEERIMQVFESTWLHNKELEMAKMQQEIEECPQGNVRRAKQYLLETMSDALKRYHVQYKTPVNIGLTLRKEMCITLGILEERDATLVNSLFEPLPSKECSSTTTQNNFTAPDAAIQEDKEEKDEDEEKKDEEKKEEGDEKEEDEREKDEKEEGIYQSDRKRQASTEETVTKRAKPSFWEYFFN